MWRRCSNANDDDAVMDKANLSCSMAAEATITSSSSSCCCPAFSWRWESQWNHHYPPPRRDDEEHHHANLIESVFLSLTSGAIVASSIGGDYARLLSKLAEHVRTSSSDFTIGLTMQCHHAWWGLLRTLKSSWEECNHVASLEPHSLELAIRSLRRLLARHPAVSSLRSPLLGGQIQDCGIKQPQTALEVGLRPRPRTASLGLISILLVPLSIRAGSNLIFPSPFGC